MDSQIENCMITCQGHSQKAFLYEWEVGLEGRQTNYGSWEPNLARNLFIVCFNKFYWNTPHLVIYVSFMAAFLPQCRVH